MKNEQEVLYLKVIVLMWRRRGGGVEPHQGVEGELPGLILLPLLEHFALPHPGLEHSPHPRHHALTQFISLASVIIHSLVRLNK